MTDSRALWRFWFFCVLLLLVFFSRSACLCCWALFIIIGCRAPRVLGSGLLLFRLLETYAQPSHSTFTIFMIMYCDYVFFHLSSFIVKFVIVVVIVVGCVALECVRACVVVYIPMDLLVWCFLLLLRNNIHCRSGRTVANYYSFPILCIHNTRSYYVRFSCVLSALEAPRSTRNT